MTDNDKPGAAATPSGPASDEAVSADVRYREVQDALAAADVYSAIAASGGTRMANGASLAAPVLAAEVRRLRLIEARQVLVEATNEQLLAANDELRGRREAREAEIEAAREACDADVLAKHDGYLHSYITSLRYDIDHAREQVRDLSDQMNSMIEQAQRESGSGIGRGSSDPCSACGYVIPEHEECPACTLEELEQRIDQLRAKLARVEALVEAWRGFGTNGDRLICADDLLQALK